jgi:hypothetical protein
MDLIKKNILGHFKFLPEKSGVDIFKINNVEIINCGLNSTKFNIAFGLPSHKNFLDSIKEIKQIFEYKPFSWWFDYNNEFHKMMLENGFSNVIEECEMICDLSKKTHNSLQAQTNLVIKQVLCNETLEDFINIMEINNKCARKFYKKFTLKDLQLKEKFFVGYFNDTPVSIASLFISDNSCSIFNLFTKNEYLKKGFGTDMMMRLMSFAKDSGCISAILFATLKGYEIYKRLGFSKSGELKVYEFK